MQRIHFDFFCPKHLSFSQYTNIDMYIHTHTHTHIP